MDLSCNYCKKDFIRNLSQYGKNNKSGHYCSRKCFSLSRRKIKTLKCHICNQNYLPKNTQSIYSIKNYCPNCRGSQIIKCLVCKSEFRQKNTNLRKRKITCCSVKCKSISQRKDWNKLTRGMLKQRYIKEFGEDNFYCRRCGHNELYNIVLHHVIYVSNSGSNYPENLEPLCLNCHGSEHYKNGNDLD